MEHSRQLVSDALSTIGFPRIELMLMRKMMVIMERYNGSMFVEEEIIYADATHYFYALHALGFKKCLLFIAQNELFAQKLTSHFSSESTVGEKTKISLK
jgi:hypothetical protein